MQDDTCNDEFMWTGVFNVKITDTCIYLLKYVRELTHKLFIRYALKFTCKMLYIVCMYIRNKVISDLKLVI